MSRVARTVVAGFGGAVHGVVLFIAACLVLAAIPPIFVSLSNTGTVNLDAFFPRASNPDPVSAQVAIEGTPAQQRSIRKAIDQLAWKVDPTAFKVRVVPAGSLAEGHMGTYVYPDSIVCIDERVLANPEHENLVHIVAHEIGHMVDLLYLDDTTRAWFMQTRGFSTTEVWAGQSATPWEARPQEDFAEVYAVLDAPFALWPIQTIGGRIQQADVMRQRIEQSMPSPHRQSRALDAASVASRANEVMGFLANDLMALQVLFVFATFYVCAFAIRSMEDQVRLARVAKSRARVFL